MAGKNEIKASVRLEGGSTFKKDITDVNKNLKQLDAESKKVSAEFDGQANSLQALTAKQKVLNKTLEEAQKKVQLYDSRIKDLEGQQKYKLEVDGIAGPENWGVGLRTLE